MYTLDVSTLGSFLFHSNYDTSLEVGPLAPVSSRMFLWKEGIYPWETRGLMLVLGPAGVSVRI